MADGFDRRSFLARGMATAAGVAMAGSAAELLTSEGAFATTNGKGKNGISTAKPKKGGTLVFGTDAEEQGFNPTQARFDEIGVMYARTVYDPLCIVTASGGVAPYLAESVVPNPDYTQWTVTLRSGLKFHNGVACDGKALLANFNAAYNSLLTGPAVQSTIKNFVQTGPLTVQVNMKSPWVPFQYYLTGQIGGQIAFIVEPSTLGSASAKPIGTGPFVYQSWVPNDHFTAVRNKSYWRSGYPYLDKITYKPIPDSDARSEALQSGAVDIMVTDTPQEILKFRGNANYAYIDDSGKVVGEPDMTCVLLNTGEAPFNNPTLRLAMAKAINPKAYNKVISVNVNSVSTGPFVKGTPYYTKTGYPSYDPSGAKKLVKQVEKETGKPVSFSFGATPDPSTQRAQAFLQNEFQAAGMKVNPTTYQQNELINNALSGKFEAYLWRQFGAVNPDMNYIFWSTTTLGSEGGISINMARNNDPDIEQDLLTGRQSTETSERDTAYQSVSKRFAQDLPYLWIVRATWAVAANPDVQNFNNPTAPSGEPAYGMIGGSIWPTQIWIK